MLFKNIKENFFFTTNFEFENSIPHLKKRYLAETGILKRLFKFIKRYLILYFKNQLRFESREILDSEKKILWINVSAPSFGDSLMDLSSRVLLEGRHIDLYTNKKIAEIYKNDNFFSNIYYDDIDTNYTYDLVILDSYSSRSILRKIHFAPKTKFVSMYGFFNGPEVNRVLFSFFKLNFLLGSKYGEEEILKIARPSLTISNSDKDLISSLSLPQNFITLAIGGEWPYRTYNNWPKVIEEILTINPKQEILLVGSENALTFEGEIIKISKNIKSYVDKLSFNQTAEVIRNSDLLICCDGGLMHAANSLETPVLALFAKLTEKMQLTPVIRAYSLYSEFDVNEIQYQKIVDKYCNYLRS